MKMLEHVKAFLGFFGIHKNRKDNDQVMIDPTLSIEQIADFLGEQQQRESSDKDFEPQTGMEMVRRYLVLYFNSLVADIDVDRADLLEKRVNGWCKPSDKSASLADYKEVNAQLGADNAKLTEWSIAMGEAYGSGDAKLGAEYNAKIVAYKKENEKLKWTFRKPIANPRRLFAGGFLFLLNKVDWFFSQPGKGKREGERERIVSRVFYNIDI